MEWKLTSISAEADELLQRGGGHGVFFSAAPCSSLLSFCSSTQLVDGSWSSDWVSVLIEALTLGLPPVFEIQSMGNGAIDGRVTRVRIRV